MQLYIGEWQIRSWQPDDEAALVRYANNRKVWLNLRDAFPFPYTVQDARTWIQLATEESPETNFAIASNQEAIGAIGLRLGGTNATKGRVTSLADGATPSCPRFAWHWCCSSARDPHVE